MNTTEVITIREFQSGDEGAFLQLNVEWITRYFVLEPKDEKNLRHPRETILDKGGRIFFALRDNEPVGCCALLYMSPGEFEVAKMAVTASAQGLGIGKRLLSGVMDAARAAGAQRLYLETNHTLTPAIRLYRSLDFEPVPAERIVPSPYERADVYMELFL